MIKFQKKPILLLTSPPTFIRKEANSKHNEVTVAVAHYAIPVANICNHGKETINTGMLKAAINATRVFPGIDFSFNGNQHAPAFTFTIKAKTERRGDDVHNQELADKIVLAKLNVKACTIMNKVVNTIGEYYCSEISALGKIAEIIGGYQARETSYIQKM